MTFESSQPLWPDLSEQHEPLSRLEVLTLFGEQVEGVDISQYSEQEVANRYLQLNLNVPYACKMPDRPIVGVLSLDKDEIWCDTKHTLNGLYLGDGVQPELNSAHDSPYYDAAFVRMLKERSGMQAYDVLDHQQTLEIDETAHQLTDYFIPKLTNERKLMPAQGIEEMRQMLRTWREAGVYVVVNTATAAGAEPGTIADIAEHLEGEVDGVVFMRNHSGDRTKLTKPTVIHEIKRALSRRTDNLLDSESIKDLSIDDSADHIKQFAEFPNSYSVVRPYPWNTYLEASDNLHIPETPTASLGALAAFQAMDAHIRTLQ